ncbi:MAG TPA: Spy/CpxP family protein refolding chaperone [Acidobacteriota bacterium]|nr:Spy/CpxP family protein refolding chaperone [Acidobacteriota bacterium]
MNMSRFYLLLCAVLAVPSISRAQVSGMTPWWDGPIARDLGLSDEQNRQIRDIVTESRGRLMELRTAVQSAEAGLRAELNAEKVDSGRAEAAIEKVVTARADLSRAVSLMTLKLRLTLTAAQWQELERRQARPGGRPGMRRPGGRWGSPRTPD